MEIGQVIQQGEVRIKRIADLPEDHGGTQRKTTDKGHILAHSESGHHHILDGGTVLDRPTKNGLESLYALLEQPQKVVQDAATPHESINLPAGVYDIRISREYNPMLGEARRVAD